MPSDPVPANVPHSLIYQDHCAVYDRLRSCMDHEGNLLKQLLNITDPVEKNIVEFGAGI